MKLFRYILVISLVATFVFSITGTSIIAKPESKISVLMGVDAAGQNMQEMAKQFTEETGIKVELSIVSWSSLSTKQATALASGMGTYDVLDTWRGWVSSYAPAGYYEPLDKYFTEDELEEYTSVIEIAKYKDHIYAAPLMSSWTIMFYNKKLFKEAGLDPTKPPKTFEQFIEYGEKLTKDYDGDGKIDQWGYIDSLAPGEITTSTYLKFLKAAGGEFWERKDGKVFFTFNSPEGVKALKLIKNLMDKYKIMTPGATSLKQQEAARLFSEGRVGMFVNWDMMTFVLNDPEQSEIVGQVGYVAMPGATAELSGSLAGHEALAIASASDNKQAAWKWIKFITSKENIKRRAIEQGFVPVYKDLMRDPEVKEAMPHLEAVLKSSKYQVIRPPIKTYQQVSDILSKQVHLALGGRKSPKEALDTAAKKMNRVLGW